MGVKGLSKLISSTPKVDLREIVQSNGGKLILAIDSSSFNFVMQANERFTNQFQEKTNQKPIDKTEEGSNKEDEMEELYKKLFLSYNQLKTKYKEFISFFRKFGIEFVVYFDGSAKNESSGEYKLETILERRKTSNSYLFLINEYLNGRNVDLSKIEIKSVSSLLSALSRAIYGELNVKMVHCFSEADFKIAKDCKNKKKGIFGVLSQDSDFAVFKGVNWIPIESIRILTSLSDDDLKIMCQIHSRESTATLLSLNDPNQLPFIAVLAGNDFIKYPFFPFSPSSLFSFFLPSFLSLPFFFPLPCAFFPLPHPKSTRLN